MQPFFSIIVPVHNAATYIDKCLISIINQTFNDYEVWIIDDGSSDNTIDVTKAIIKNQSNFNIYKLKKNRGVAQARNIGIKKAKGKYVCFLDDDDMWLKNKLQVEHDCLVQKDQLWVFSNYEVLNEDYKHIGTRFRVPGMYNYEKILNRGNPIGMLTVAIKTEILKQNLFRNVGHEDYDLWLRLARLGYQGYLIKDVLAQYVKRTNSKSSNKLKGMVWTYQCFRRNGCKKLKSMKLIVNYGLNVLIRKNK